MAHYQIFVPESTYKDQGETHPLVCAGLPDHVESADKLPIAEGEGLSPSGERGLLYAWRTSKSSKGLHYNPETQDWVPAVPYEDLEGGRYWIGFWKDSPVSEADCRRKELHYGTDVRLGNGEEWHLVLPGELPGTIYVGEKGQMMVRPKARYRELYMLTMRFRAQLRDPDLDLPWQVPYEFLCKCLRMNYRLPHEVIDHLELFDESNIKGLTLLAIRPRE